MSPEFSRVSDEPSPAEAQRFPDIPKYALLRDSLKSDTAPCGQIRKTGSDFSIHLARWLRAKRTKTSCESKLTSLSPDEVQRSEAILFVVQAQSAPKLLKIHCQALGWPQKKDCIHFGYVDAFVVKIDHKDEVQLPAAEPIPSGVPFVVGSARSQCDGGNTAFGEKLRHELGMRHAYTESQSASPANVEQYFPDLVHNQPRANIVPCVHLIEIVHAVPAALPLEAVKVHAVANAEVLEGA
jgi:hypothetical protein